MTRNVIHNILRLTGEVVTDVVCTLWPLWKSLRSYVLARLALRPSAGQWTRIRGRQRGISGVYKDITDVLHALIWYQRGFWENPARVRIEGQGVEIVTQDPSGANVKWITLLNVPPTGFWVRYSDWNASGTQHDWQVAVYAFPFQGNFLVQTAALSLLIIISFLQ